MGILQKIRSAGRIIIIDESLYKKEELAGILFKYYGLFNVLYAFGIFFSPKDILDMLEIKTYYQGFIFSKGIALVYIGLVAQKNPIEGAKVINSGILLLSVSMLISTGSNFMPFPIGIIELFILAYIMFDLKAVLNKFDAQSKGKEQLETYKRLKPLSDHANLYFLTLIGLNILLTIAKDGLVIKYLLLYIITAAAIPFPFILIYNLIPRQLLSFRIITISIISYFFYGTIISRMFMPFRPY